jgi:DNA-binding NtrC family response regulator
MKEGEELKGIKTLMVVEDGTMHHILSLLLDQWGLSITAGKEPLHATQYALLVCDAASLLMDDIEYLFHVKPALKIILVASTGQLHSAESLPDRAVQYLLLPVSEGKLKAALEELFSNFGATNLAR